MEKLVDFLTSKIGYTLTIIAGFIVPGVMLIFIWNRELYMQLDLIKLLLASFGISFFLYIPLLIFGIKITSIVERVSKKEVEGMAVLLVPVFLTVVEIMLLMTIKIINTNYSMLDFVKEFGVTTFWCVAIISGIDFLLGLFFKIKK